MPVAIAVALTVALSGLLAMMVVWTPGLILGVRNYQRLSLLSAILGVVVAAATVGVMVGAPIVHGTAAAEWSSILVTYFLATASRLGGPYAFFWTQRWMYPVGSLVPLVAFGAVIAIAGGYSALPVARRAGIALMIVGSGLVLALMIGGVYTAWVVRDGIPV